MQTYILFFLGIVLHTLGAAVICGLAVYLCRTLFVRLLGRGAGRVAVIGTSIIGTPVHELGHAVMCLLFGHRITKMVLWQPRSPDGTLGYVSHAYHPRNPYHILGNLFIGLGPIFSGLGVLILVLWLCFPVALTGYMDATRRMIADGEGILTVLFAGMRLVPSMIGEAMTDGAVPLWARLLGVLVLLSVSLHIELSPSDIKSALKAIPLYLILAALVTLVCALIGDAAMTAVGDALMLVSAVEVALFTVVLVIALVQVLMALPVGLIRYLRKR